MGDELRAGDVIADRYELRAPLGRGGTSTAWRALDRTTASEIALKRLEVARAADWKYVELFEREGKLLAQIDHPAIPRYLGAFTVENAGGTSFFLAQSLIDGTSLAEQVEERGTFGEGEARDIARQVLAILADLHAMTPPVLHRDLKPGNIILDASKRAHLVDFGAARRRGEDTGSTVVGTYGFMAPEQLRGSAVPASDLYGLGATLVYLLYRVTPAELPQKRLRVELPAKPGLSPSFAAFLRRLLEPAPEDRFASAASALMGIDARPPSSSSARTAILGGVLVALVVGGGLFAWQTTRAKKPPVEGGAKPSFPELPLRLDLARFDEFRDLERVPAHVSAVFDVAFSPDGKHAVSASFDHSAKVWSTDTWKTVATMGHDGPVGGARFANATTLVTAGDHTLRTWSLPGGKPALKVDVGTVQVSAIDVRGNAAAIASFDGNARLVSLTDGTITRTLACSPKAGRVLHLAFSPDGKRLATGGDDRVVRIWNVGDGALERSIKEHTAAISHVAFSPDGTFLASTGDDKVVRVFTVSEGRAVTTLSQASDHTWGLAWSPAGNYLAVGGKDTRLRVYAVPTYEPKFEDGDDAKGTLSIVFAPDGRMLTGHGDGSFHVRALPGDKKYVLPTAKTLRPKVVVEAPKEAALAQQASDLIERWEGHRARLDGAEKLAREALSIKPKFAPALVQLARIEARRGYRSGRNYEPASLTAARKLLDEAIANDPKCFEAREVLAWMIIRQKDLEGGREAIAAAEKLEPLNPRTGLLRAEIAVREKAWAEAERLLRTVIEGGFATASDVESVEETLIEVYGQLGDYDAVDELHRRALKRSPNSAWMRGNYAGFLNGRGEYGRAMEVAKEAIALSDYPAAHRELSVAHIGSAVIALWDKHDPQTATSHARTALKEHPEAWHPHYVMAAIHRMRAVRGRDKAALAQSNEELKIALKLEPKSEFLEYVIKEHAEIEKSL